MTACQLPYDKDNVRGGGGGGGGGGRSGGFESPLKIGDSGKRTQRETDNLLTVRINQS